MEQYDLIVKGGQVLDPGSNLDDRQDVAFKDGRIAAIEAAISASDGNVVLDATDRYVVPGLIDLHAHVYTGVCQLVVPIDEVAPMSGVTTVVSTGDAGSHTFPGFYQQIISQSRTRVLAFVHISSIGLAGWPVGEMINIDYADAEGAASIVRRYSDVCVGVKVRQSADIVGENGLEPLRQAVRAAEMVDAPVMVHIGNVPASLSEVLDILRPGDIVTHCFTGRENGVTDEQGNIIDAAIEARERGIYFDVAHGMGSFDFTVAENALAQGFLPDFISSDLHSGCVNGPSIDLPTTMTKFMNMGMDFAQTVELTTAAPAAVLGMQKEIGSLQVGACGDAAILEVVDEPATYYDAEGNSRDWDRRIVARNTIRDGRLWGRPFPHPYRYAWK